MDLTLPLLFLSAFAASTIVPASSELVLGGLVLGAETGGRWTLLTVATAGNTLGAVVNWALGRYLAAWRGRRWFPLSPRQHERAVRWFRRYGLWSLLFSWVPVVGDPLTVVAGLLRTPLVPFTILVALGKGARYWVVLELVTRATGGPP